MSILDLKNLTKSFGGVRAVDGMSVGFDAGKITALVGPNGAGKTTVFNLVSGHLEPDVGEIIYKGSVISGLPSWEIAAAGVGRLFQDVRVFPKMTVRDNIMVSFPGQIGEHPFYSIAAPWRVSRQDRDLLTKTDHLLRFVGLTDLADQFAENLSYGQQKLLAIARLTASASEVFLLDEPTAGIGVAMVQHLLELIKDLAQRGKTIIIIEHNMNVVLEVSDWVYFMERGQITSFGLAEDVLSDPEVRASYMGI